MLGVRRHKPSCIVELLPCKTSFTGHSTVVVVVYTYYSTAVVLVLEHDRQEQVLGNAIVVWRSEC